MLEHILIEHGLEEGLKLLTSREQKVLTWYYLAGYGDGEIAMNYKVTRESIHKIRKKGINKLKKYQTI